MVKGDVISVKQAVAGRRHPVPPIAHVPHSVNTRPSTTKAIQVFPFFNRRPS